MFTKGFRVRVDFPFKMLTRPYASWPMVIVLITPWVRMAGQTEAAPAGREPVKTPAVPAAEGSITPAAARATMETLARKQRETTLAAMQAAVNEQRDSLLAGFAASTGKPELQPVMPGAPAAETPFFILPAIAAADGVSVSFAMPEMAIADVEDCAPVSDAEIAPVLLEAAQREGLERRLLTAVILRESAFRPCAISHKGAQGLMQLMPGTIEQFGVQDPFDVKQNIDAGAKYLKELLARYSGDVSLALAAYNAGPSKVDAAGGVPQISETTAYVNEILGILNAPAAIPKIPNK